MAFSDKRLPLPTFNAELPNDIAKALYQGVKLPYENVFSERIAEIITVGAHNEELENLTAKPCVDPPTCFVDLKTPSKVLYDDDDAVVALGVNPDEPGSTAGSFGNMAPPDNSECVSLEQDVDQFKDTGTNWGKVSGDNEEDVAHQSIDNTLFAELLNTLVAHPGSLHFSWKKFVCVFAAVTVASLGSASGTPLCDDVLRLPIQSGVSVQCIVTMTPRAVVHLSINGTCNIPLSPSPPCDGALSYGSCGPYISVAVNTSTCAVFILTIISDPSVNNTNITITYPSKGLSHFYRLNVEGLTSMLCPSGNTTDSLSPKTATIATGKSSSAPQGQSAPLLLMVLLVIIATLK